MSKTCIQLRAAAMISNSVRAVNDMRRVVYNTTCQEDECAHWVKGQSYLKVNEGKNEMAEITGHCGLNK